MAVDNSHSQDVDLDRTDRLPILEGAVFDDDVEDDAVPLEYTASMPTIKHDFPRPPGVDLPSLAESVRSVEERIARQSADHEALTRAYDKSREAETAATSRAHALAAELAALRPAFEAEQGATLAKMAAEHGAVQAKMEAGHAALQARLEAEHSAERSRLEVELASLRAQFDTERTALRAQFEAEQSRARDADRLLSEKGSAAEQARARSEEALRDAERFHSESVTLRNTLAERDAAIAQALHSLGERDAQLVSLQREHAQLVPKLEAQVEEGTRYAAELRTVTLSFEEASAELKRAQGSVAVLTTKLKAGVVELNSARTELSGARAQAASYLEQLSTREWRRGFDHNLFRELDAEIGSAQDVRGALQSERDRLRHQVAELMAQVAARDDSIAKLKAAATEEETLLAKQGEDILELGRERAELKDRIAAVEAERDRLNEALASQHESVARLEAAAAADEARHARYERDLQNLDGARSSLLAQIDALEGERERLQADVAAKAAATLAALAAGASEAERIRTTLTAENERIKSALTAENARISTSLISENERITALLTGDAERLKALHHSELTRVNVALAAAEQARADLTAEVEELKSEARNRDDEMSVLMAHLQEARRPIQAIEAEVKRLTDDLAAKTLTLEALTEDNRNLRLSIERTKGALEEREFLIRRLERSESNNANVLGRIQTSIERLGAPAGLAGSAAQPVECTAELARIDGQHNTSYTLARRTRIGRAPGCELRIDSSSVSRHHALLLLGQRDAIIEDLNSTNGVIVNGRKISRQMLNDGDMVTIGEAQFRFNLTLAPRVLEAPAAE
jgi:ParB family chromosome partitioning protein